MILWTFLTTGEYTVCLSETLSAFSTEFNPGTFGLGYKGPNEYWWLEYDRKRRIEAFNILISIYEQKVHSKK